MLAIGDTVRVLLLRLLLLLLLGDARVVLSATFGLVLVLVLVLTRFTSVHRSTEFGWLFHDHSPRLFRHLLPHLCLCHLCRLCHGLALYRHHPFPLWGPGIAGCWF